MFRQNLQRFELNFKLSFVRNVYFLLCIQLAHKVSATKLAQLKLKDKDSQGERGPLISEPGAAGQVENATICCTRKDAGKH